MKKLLLIVFVCLSSVAFAQVEKGDFAATANFNYSSQKFDGADAMNTTTLNLRAGYFFTQNIEAGASLMIMGTGDITMTGFGPYAVYNFLTANGKMLPYVGANFYRMDMGIDAIDPINQIGGFGGLKYFLTEAVFVDGNLNYTSWLGDYDGSTLTFNLGIGINFGKLK